MNKTMNKKQMTTIVATFMVVTLLTVSSVWAAGLSVQLKRTNPGVAGDKSAELIFDVVNTDMTHKLEGFLWCMSPDDAIVSSSLGAGTGSGAQYVSPMFTMDTGPYQKAMSLTIDADSPGDKRTGCIVKYIPYKETAITGTETPEKVQYKGLVDTQGTDVSGFVVTLLEYTEAVEATNATGAVKASVKIDVDGTPKVVTVGSTETIGTLTVKVNSATAESADVEISGEKIVAANGATVKKEYQKMNGQYIGTPQDMDYRELRLDKTIPFVTKMSDPQCPTGKTSCTADEVSDTGGVNVPKWALYAGIGLVVLGVAYFFGRSAGKERSI